MKYMFVGLGQHHALESSLANGWLAPDDEEILSAATKQS